MALIYDKKVFQLLNIKSQNNRKRPMSRCIYCINVQGIKSIWIASLHYRWRNVGRGVKYTDTIVVLWFQKSVFQGMTKSACADPVASVVTAWCPVPCHPIFSYSTWPDPQIPLPRALRPFPWLILSAPCFRRLTGEALSWDGLCFCSAPFSTQQNARVEQLCLSTPRGTPGFEGGHEEHSCSRIRAEIHMHKGSYNSLVASAGDTPVEMLAKEWERGKKYWNKC